MPAFETARAQDEYIAFSFALAQLHHSFLPDQFDETRVLISRSIQISNSFLVSLHVDATTLNTRSFCMCGVSSVSASEGLRRTLQSKGLSIVGVVIPFFLHCVGVHEGTRN